MLNKVLRSGAKASRENQRSRSVFWREVEEALSAESDQPLDVLILEAVPLGVRNMGCQVAETTLATDAVLCRLARSSPEGS